MLYEDNFQFLKDVLSNVHAKVIAEGNVITPEMLQIVDRLGVHCTVVGSAITRPKEITQRFC
ncbi:N-acetylmannosamine-6-phosphate 2-epimerase [Staphylococcus gallinarum]|uniref:N-acylglucosamine-6-phosphate 2-epimerase n=1 Tax=Staphylococcus gallinarum TaxID=1293 RepID=A0A380FKZ5_STAGA|nr:N-acetylmannosamine-6-phosphate 2-epimerase [Staphylococcus gallinarum]